MQHAHLGRIDRQLAQVPQNAGWLRAHRLRHRPPGLKIELEGDSSLGVREGQILSWDRLVREICPVGERLFEPLWNTELAERVRPKQV